MIYFYFRIWNSCLTLIRFELFRDVIATFYEAERGKKLYSWSYFTWSRWIFALRRWLYTGLAHILCRIYVQMCFKSQHLRQRNRRLPFRPINSLCASSLARERAGEWRSREGPRREKENLPPFLFPYLAVTSPFAGSPRVPSTPIYE